MRPGHEHSLTEQRETMKTSNIQIHIQKNYCLWAPQESQTLLLSLCVTIPLVKLYIISCLSTMLNSNSSTILFLQEEVLAGATPDHWDLRMEEENPLQRCHMSCDRIVSAQLCQVVEGRGNYNFDSSSVLL